MLLVRQFMRCWFPLMNVSRLSRDALERVCIWLTSSLVLRWISDAPFLRTCNHPLIVLLWPLRLPIASTVDHWYSCSSQQAAMVIAFQGQTLNPAWPFLVFFWCKIMKSYSSRHCLRNEKYIWMKIKKKHFFHYGRCKSKHILGLWNELTCIISSLASTHLQGSRTLS